MSVPNETTGATDDLADHVEESVDAVAKFQQEHYRSSTGLQLAINHFTGVVGRPYFLIGLVAVLAVWIGAAVVATGGRVDRPEFAWVELAATVTALLATVLILVTQRHENQLAERRAQLILQLVVLSDKKNAKIIALLEELRRDMPTVTNRVDVESEDMQKSTDPMTVLAAMDKRDPKAETN